jgi:hypothetical protein
MSAYFTNPHDPENVALTAQLQRWTAELYEVPQQSIHITEVKCCTEPHCPNHATLIDTTEFVLKIHKPLVYVRKFDLTNATIEKIN